MVYNIEEYNNVFDTPMKKQQERVIVTKIMQLLNRNKYDNLDELQKKNPDYNKFLENNELQTVMKHFGNTINDDDYKRIIDRLKQMTKNKQDYDKENINKQTIDDKEYVAYNFEDKSIILDNTNSKQTIEERLNKTQQSSNSFQTSNIEENTRNMFASINENTKDGLRLKPLREIAMGSLSEEEKNIYKAAMDYELETGEEIQIDIERQIFVNKDGEIKSITKKDGNFIVSSQNDSQEEIVTKEEIQHVEENLGIKDTQVSNETNSEISNSNDELSELDQDVISDNETNSQEQETEKEEKEEQKEEEQKEEEQQEQTNEINPNILNETQETQTADFGMESNENNIEKPNSEEYDSGLSYYDVPSGPYLGQGASTIDNYNPMPEPTEDLEEQEELGHAKTLTKSLF